MDCKLCKRKAKPYEPFWSLSLKYVDEKEYSQRKKDGRTTKIQKVCVECVTEKTGRTPLGLQDINTIRERGINEDQYYKENEK